MFELSYVSPDGRHHFEMFYGEDGPFIVLDSLSGLVGEFQDTPIQTVGVPGARVDFRDRVVAPMTGSFTLVVLSVEQWLSVRQAFSTTKYGRLELRSEGRIYSCPVRLSASLPAPQAAPKHGSTVEVSLVSDGDRGGVWSRSYQSDKKSVTVTNLGDVPVWPTVEWEGSGGAVTLPSGATLELPAVDRPHFLPLARNKAGKVTSDRGFEPEVTKKIGAVGEQVPVGEERTFSLPGGAKLHWREGVLDPWI